MPDTSDHAQPLWHTAADGTRYPPEPWYLGGTLLLSVFRVGLDELPPLADVLPPAHDPLVVDRQAVVGLALVEYSAGGVLAYDELLVAVPTHAGSAIRITIPQIWVTTAASAMGGRELWGIPKEQATVTRRPLGTATQADVRAPDGAPIARLTARTGGRLLPGRFPVPLVTAQRLDGRTVVSRNRVVTPVHRLSARWDLPASGPLGHLTGRTPWLSVAMPSASIVFGDGVTRS